MNTKTLLIAASLVAGAITLAGCSKSNPDNSPSLQTTPETTTLPSGESTKSFTLDEISKHSSPQDCWLAIEGKVYDITPFISSGKHPGGPVIVTGCGKDATQLFNQRPEDSKPHSNQARDMLPDYYIGKLNS